MLGAGAGGGGAAGELDVAATVVGTGAGDGESEGDALADESSMLMLVTGPAWPADAPEGARQAVTDSATATASPAATPLLRSARVSGCRDKRSRNLIKVIRPP